MPQERNCDVVVPLGYSDDFGPSSQNPELEAVLGPFDNICFRTRVIGLCAVDLLIRRNGVPIGPTTKVDRKHLLAGFAPAAEDFPDAEELKEEPCPIRSRIERGRFVEMAVLENNQIRLRFIATEE